MLLDLIAGARPNFVKLAPIIRAVQEAKEAGHNISYRFIHTGQHYSQEMSVGMLRDLRMPSPDIELRCSGRTRGAMLASVVKEYDAVLQKKRPDWALVVGDVTSTLGAALAAKASDVRVAHVEAGLRSGDRAMPEELNRIATDAISDLYLTTTESAGQNLGREGVAADLICLVGNTMADTLVQTLPFIKRPQVFSDLNLKSENYALLTLHRPANVDDPVLLVHNVRAVANACSNMPVVFPAHPRTVQSLSSRTVLPSNIHLIAPLPYASFLYLQQHAGIIITDSGGVSEEATILHKPCVTLRTTTERPETVIEGTNVLALAVEDLPASMAETRTKARSMRALPAMWDGRTSQRIVNTLLA